jgi:predicted RND superfamily exporter protein
VRSTLKTYSLTDWSVSHPRLTIGLIVILTAVFAAFLPRMRTDTDPKNMLPASSHVRVFNDQVDGWFGLHKDVIVVGVFMAWRAPT